MQLSPGLTRRGWKIQLSEPLNSEVWSRPRRSVDVLFSCVCGGRGGGEE